MRSNKVWEILSDVQTKLVSNGEDHVVDKQQLGDEEVLSGVYREMQELCGTGGDEVTDNDDDDESINLGPG